MMIPSPRLSRKARIEIIPLIDVMFFLLATFVMVSLSMIQNKGITVNLPSSSTSAPQEQKDSVTISVSSKGEIFFEKEPVNVPMLKTRLARLKNHGGDPKVFIHGDAKSELGDFFRVIDAVRETGIAKIAIHTKPQSTESPPPKK